MRHDTPQYELIASCLAGARRETGGEWDWDSTVYVAAREEVLPALHCKLACPDEIADFFEAVHELNAKRNFELIREVEMLAALLNQHGIEPVLLKGAAYLIAGVYTDIADRYLRDIDFLVSPNQSAQAFALIRQTGYEPYVPNPTALVRHHHPTLTQAGRIPVEIHHSLGLGACRSFLTADEIVNAATAFRLGGAKVYLPSTEHLMTHLILHSQMQHRSYDRIWPTLRAMHDLVRLGQRFHIPWDDVRGRFRAHRKSALLNVHLLQIEKAMGVAPPFAITRGGLRWWYRQALWRETRLRYIDPMLAFSRVVAPKLDFSLGLLKDPVGRKYLLSTPFRKAFYKRLLSDLVDV